MTVVAAWDFPGGDGDAATFPLGLPALRTGAGEAARTIIVVRNVDTLDPSQRGCFWGCRRNSAIDYAMNHSICFEPTNNNIEFQYSLSPTFEQTANCESAANVWVADCYCDPGNGGNITLRRIPLSTATQAHSVSGADGGSFFDDGQQQRFYLGAVWNGSAWLQELDGQIAFFLYIHNTALSQSECEAFVADPLNEGDALCQTHGANAWFWDDSGADVGINGLAAPSLQGSVTRTDGIGPDVPERSAPTGDPPSLTQVGDLNIVFSHEERVLCTVANLGAEVPLVHLTSDPNGVNNQVAQTVYSYNGTTELRIHVALGSLTAGQLYLFITNQTPGENFGLRDSLLITVLADPGTSTIGLRSTPPTVNVPSGASVTIGMKKYFFASYAQGNVAYSEINNSFPAGPSINSSTGLISGTLSAGAEDDSPYTATVRCTDASGASVDGTFSWSVAEPTGEPPPPAGPRVPGSWGQRGAE
jgi:hypothetical protein